MNNTVLSPITLARGAFSRIERRASVFVVIRNRARHPDLGLADLLDARVFQARQRARIGHVGVKYRLGLRQRLVDRRMDAEAGTSTSPSPRLTLPSSMPTSIEAGSRDLGPMHPERNLVVAVA